MFRVHQSPCLWLPLLCRSCRLCHPSFFQVCNHMVPDPLVSHPFRVSSQCIAVGKFRGVTCRFRAVWWDWTDCVCICWGLLFQVVTAVVWAAQAAWPASGPPAADRARAAAIFSMHKQRESRWATLTSVEEWLMKESSFKKNNCVRYRLV